MMSEGLLFWPLDSSCALNPNRRQLEKISANKHADTVTKMGAILATGILEGGGRNLAVKLVSKTKRDKMTAVLGLAVFSQFWFWHPLVCFLSLAFSPTFLIGLNYDMKVPVYQSSNLSLMPSCPFLPTRVQPPCPPPMEFLTAVLSTLARAKARASDADKMQVDSPAGEEQKAEPEPTFEILTNPARVVPAQEKLSF